MTLEQFKRQFKLNSNINYLLNGNKVQLYFIEMNSRFFISRATKEGEIKALYYRLIRNFTYFLPHIINPFKPLRNCEAQTKTRMHVIK